MIFTATPPWDGTLAKYYVNAADFCYKVPDSMTLEEAAMVEPVSVEVAIAKTADLRAHQTVLVLGCGAIGVLCQAVAKSYGAKTVIGVDVVQSRLYSQVVWNRPCFLPSWCRAWCRSHRARRESCTHDE